MAVVRSVERGTRRVSVHKSEVDLTYQTVSGPDGELLFHIATYGSDTRQDVGSTSQSMQFDREQAVHLIAAMREAFPGLAAT
jgi:hypothetical protein